MTRGYLAPLTGPAREHAFVGFDTEGDGRPGGFLLGAVCDDDGVSVYRGPSALLASLLTHRNRSRIILAHNLEYDLGVLAQDDLSGWSFMRLHSRMIKATYRDGHDHTWDFWDTSNLSYFASIEALGVILGIPKLEPPEWLVHFTEHPEDRAPLSPERWARLGDYCARDAEICYGYGCYIQSIVGDLGGEVKATLPSTAMDIWRRCYLDREVLTPDRPTNDLCREAYYGGRTEAFRYGSLPSQYHYDVHSLYPSVMLEQGLPDPAGLYLYQHECSERIIRSHEGITRCVVEAPAMHVPMLPVRIAGRLMFPTGVFEGSWCHNELRAALEVGYRIRNIRYQLATRGAFPLLSGYVADLYHRKVLAERAASPAYFVYKLALNSLYGKFGQLCDDSLTTFARIDAVPNFLDRTGIDVVTWQGETYVSEPLGGDRQPAYIIVLWAAYIAAAARVREWGLLREYGSEIAYADTDCAVGPHPLPTGPGLGELGLERGPVDYEVRGEKYYRWALGGGKWGYRKAGIAAAFQAAFWEHGRVTYPRPTKLGESVRRDVRMSVWLPQVKTDTPRYPKRCPLAESWPESGYVNTRPWSYTEAHSMLSSARPLLSHRGSGLVSARYVAREEERDLEMWRLRSEISALREALTIPADVLFRFRDYRSGTWRRQRNKSGRLVAGEYAVTDEVATERGYPDSDSFRAVMERELRLRENIRRLEDDLRTVTQRVPEVEVCSDPLPF